MTCEELISIKAGSSIISTTVLNTLIRLVTTSFELGKSLGSSIRRAMEKNKC